MGYADLNLSSQEQSALEDFIRRVATQFADRYVRAALFGCKARRRSHAESDLDVAVILNGLTSEDKIEIYDIAAEELLKFEVDISPLVFGSDRYEQLKAEGYSLIREIERDQIAL